METIMTTTDNKANKDEKTARFCSFFLEDRMFGVDISAVKEINDESHITRIYHAPDEIRGYVNIRGQIFLVLDLRHLMGMEKQEIRENSKLVLLKTELMEYCAVLVDDIGDVVEVRVDLIEDRRKGRMDKKPLMDRRKDRSQISAGVCKLDRGLMVVIEPRSMLRYVDEKVVNRV
jgi:chemotaxis signal transduction protein